MVAHAAELERRVADDARELERGGGGARGTDRRRGATLATVVSRHGGDPLRRLRRDDRPPVELDRAARRRGATGIVLSSILHREQARFYAKWVVERRVRARPLAGGTRGDRRGDGWAQGPGVRTRALPPPAGRPVSVAYLGPAGTFSEDALLAATGGDDVDDVPKPTIFEAIQAVAGGEVDRALVPFENSIEGAVRATLDALAFDVEGVAIVGEHDHPVRHALIASPGSAIGRGRGRPLPSRRRTRSAPASSASVCPQATVRAATSTAEAVRSVSLSKAIRGRRSAPRRPPASTTARSSRRGSRTHPTTSPASSGSPARAMPRVEPRRTRRGGRRSSSPSSAQTIPAPWSRR